MFLGSGGAFPTSRRMTSSAVLLREGEMFLFDCGEAMQLQLARSRLGWARLKAAFITHLHGDHVLGIPGILMTMGLGERTEPFTIYGPPGLAEYVRLTRRFLRFGVPYPLEVRETEGGVLLDNRQYSLEAVPVEHRVPTLAYRLVEKPRPGRFDVAAAERLGVPPGPLFKRLQEGAPVVTPSDTTVLPEQVLGSPRPGRKFVYMVDTRPCREGVDFARGADLLIHDAMFDDELADEAVRRRHSTAREAATMAASAGVSRLLLTHISPRYQDISTFVSQAREVFPETRVARDLDVYEIAFRQEE
ncbi:MAG TPA: ribonuclease Z [bacterium]|nr:ribonuclease Z [bacterium]HPQ66441.1 ribonuclease Z [bacterium]